MTNKNLFALIGAAVVLGGAAWFVNGGSKSSAPKLNGRKVLPPFDMGEVASIDVGGKVRLVAGDGGWTVATMQDYPADRAKIVENLMKLTELKVGQVVRGKTISERTAVELRDASGKSLASLALGERHEKWGFGRYAEFDGSTVLVSDTLDAFGDDPKRWVETKIVDEPWISFKELADPALTEAELGFATGVVATVTVAGDTNRTVTVGNVVKSSTDRYLKLDGVKWVFVVPSYSVEKFLPKPPKDEPKAEAKVESESVAAESADGAAK